jgi:hypothetical protein
LEILMHVIHSFTHFMRSHLQISPFIFIFQFINCNNSYQSIKWKWMHMIPRKEYRSWKIPGCVGTSNTWNCNLVQSMVEGSTRWANFMASWKLSLPNLDWNCEMRANKMK